MFIKLAILTSELSQKSGHGRKRCPDPLVEVDTNGDTGNTNGGMDAGGGWDGGNQTTSSAPADWEQNGTYAPSAAPVVAGGGW